METSMVLVTGISGFIAEHAAWAWAADNGWKDRLVVVNPGLVLGPAMDGRIRTSLDVVKMFMAGGGSGGVFSRCGRKGYRRVASQRGDHARGGRPPPVGDRRHHEHATDLPDPA